MAVTQPKTPGVYVIEKDAFPNAVVAVPTAVPAFIGYTERAQSGKTPLTNVPMRITSLDDYQALFGGPAPISIGQDPNDKTKMAVDKASRFLLFESLRLFYDNGGGDAWIVSVGNYGTPGSPTAKSQDDFTNALDLLVAEPEPTMIVAPDATLLGSLAEWQTVAQQTLDHCAKMQSRIAIFDIYMTGAPSPTYNPVDVFRDKIGNRELNYGTVYWPYLNSTILTPNDLTFLNLAKSERATVLKTAEAELKALNPAGADKIMKLVKAATTAEEAKQPHQALMNSSPSYKETMTHALELANVLPPSAAMAGVYTFTDNSVGVWKAPANVSLSSVASPTLKITSDEQEDLNAPLDGLAVNAIRTFLGRGVLVWGARTLDANSLDWRYINVRRTLIMLEQSIKEAMRAYVFAPNDSSTWVTVASMIENFLTNQWKAGALVGATPAEAFEVHIGLGSTMTSQDILEGNMRVTIKVAVSHPAEFIILTFQQKLQTS